MGDKVLKVDDLQTLIDEKAFEIPDDGNGEPPPPPPPPPTEPEFKLEYPADKPVVITQLYARNPQWYNPLGLKGHEGLDLRAANSSTIRAGAAGEVIRAETNANSGAYGIHVRIKSVHPEGTFKHIYAHFKQALVQEGDVVVAGQEIGLADNTGNSSGSHLHLTLKREGTDAAGLSWMGKSDIIDPTPYMVDIFPGVQWNVDVRGNFRQEPKIDNNVIRLIPAGQLVQAVDHKPEWGDWWQIMHQGTIGFFWGPYKLSPV